MKKDDAFKKTVVTVAGTCRLTVCQASYRPVRGSLQGKHKSHFSLHQSARVILSPAAVPIVANVRIVLRFTMRLVWQITALQGMAYARYIEL